MVDRHSSQISSLVEYRQNPRTKQQQNLQV